MKKFSNAGIFIIALSVCMSFSVSAFGSENPSYKVRDQIRLRDRSLPGAKLYQLYCSVCHGDKGNGTSWTSPNLSRPPIDFTKPGVSVRLNRGRMFRSIKHGVDSTAMVGWRIQLTDDEINRVIDYIRNNFFIKSSGINFSTGNQHNHDRDYGSATITGKIDGNFGEGKQLYEKHCVPCHGIKGDGNGPRAYFITPRPRSFTEPGETTAISDLNTLFIAIKKGVRGTVMPAWEQVLPDKKIMDLAVYVREAFINKSLKKKPPF